MAELESFLKGRKPFTFIDLFAGAGGISEGFLQADANGNYFDFLLASDINENCEVTHRARYNETLGLKTQFVTEDIMSADFLPKLQTALGGKEVDVVTGGPSCQSFSLAGRRRRFDKRDNLFDRYLKVIRTLRPKYFVMENVKGILTKDNGRFKVEIMKEMRSIIDDKEVDGFLKYLKGMVRRTTTKFMADTLICKFTMELAHDDETASKSRDLFFENLESHFRRLTRRMDYRTSKSDINVNTIRHGLALLRRSGEREAIAASVVNIKTAANVDNDLFIESMNSFMASIADDAIIDRIVKSVDELGAPENADEAEVEQFKRAIAIFSAPLDDCFEIVKKMAEEDRSGDDLTDIMSRLRLYNINQMVLTSSDYGVPQNRERVVYIGSRKDQKEIKAVAPTVEAKDRVTVYEAINDLDFIGNGQTLNEYRGARQDPELDKLVKTRKVDGSVDNDGGKTYAQWSRDGRLTTRFTFDKEPFYVKDKVGLHSPQEWHHSQLFNHQTSGQNETVRERLCIIAQHGGYTEECKEELKEKGLESAKRNYFVLRPDSQSPTVCTMPDDFIHYSAMRPMTVREMARLQSFDDSFVFQGKRQTGGDKRKSEIPQYTLVGNAVPPLMARAIGNEILRNIE